ncbi:MAG TPA: 3-dehydroquinate synthase, partial [Candidatus Nitrosopelagicus sp.]|nr:3-dehydroquinate synthase [Candidatus Nitrosopelagicus sp.]
MTSNKQLIIQPKVAKNHLAKFVKNLENEGIKMIFADPKSLTKTKIQTIFPSQNANYVI